MQRALKSYFPLLSICIIYVLATLPSLFSRQHILYNLEPYPDGLLYIQPAFNVVTGITEWSFSLHHAGVSLQAWVPPLYSVVLALGYFFWHQVQAFYLVNVVLGLASLVCFFQFLLLTTKNKKITTFGSLFFLASAYVLWLPTIPMAENISLTLFCGGLYVLGLLQKKSTPARGLVLALVMSGLVFTKYVLAPVSLAFMFGGISIFVAQKQVKHLLIFFITLGILGCFFLSYAVTILHFNPFQVFSPQLETKTASQLTAFSFQYFSLNSKFYALTMLGLPTQFLWLKFSLLTPILALTTFLGTIYTYYRKSVWQKEVTFLLGALAATFLSVCLFYAQDARYVLLSIPIFVAITTIFVAQLTKDFPKQLKVLGGVMVFILLLHLTFQLSFFKYLIAQNILHRTQAWQYESILVFNQYFTQSQDAYLITVLPPFLIDLYTNNMYQVLPLSLRQEFMNQNQRTWPVQNYADLNGEYRRLLLDGKKVYVTNAYLSSQHEFQADYQNILNSFKIKPVATGCYETCNIYELSL